MNPLNEQIGGSYYKDMVIQPVEYIHKNGIGFIAGAIIKYVSRYKKKNGKQDLEKARHFIDVLTEMEYPVEKINKTTSSTMITLDENDNRICEYTNGHCNTWKLYNNCNQCAIKRINDEKQQPEPHNLIYISGPMSCYPQYNFLAFFHAETILTIQGWRCINPARTSWELAVKKNCMLDDITREEYLEQDLKDIEKCNSIFMLHGHGKSMGTRIELNKAKELGLNIFYQKDGYPKYNA